MQKAEHEATKTEDHKTAAIAAGVAAGVAGAIAVGHHHDKKSETVSYWNTKNEHHN